MNQTANPAAESRKVVCSKSVQITVFMPPLNVNTQIIKIAKATDTEKGTLVRDCDRTIRHDLLFRVRRLTGQRLPSLPERVERFYLGE